MAKEIQTLAYMTPQNVQDISISLWGDEAWRKSFQDAFDISYSQLHRYMSVYKGQLIPKSIALALDMMVTLKANDIPLPDLADYLTPIDKVEPLIFKPEKKVKIPRVINDAPIADFFDLGTETAPETSPEPEPAETKPKAKPERTETKPATEPKAKPEGKKKPSLAKASVMLGTMMPQPKKRRPTKAKA